MNFWRNSTSSSIRIPDLRADYAAMRESRFRARREGLLRSGSSGDYHYRWAHRYYELIELARDMDRNDAVIAPAVDRAVMNTVQNGFTIDPQTPDNKLNLELESRWNDWANNASACEASATMDFAAIQEQVFRSMLVDGDIFVLLRDDGRLQLVEAHRCRGPQGVDGSIFRRALRWFGGANGNSALFGESSPVVILGVELDSQRRRLAYWFTPEDIDPLSQTSAMPERFPAWAQDEPLVLHLYNPRRISQTRGVTAFAPVFDAADMFESINQAKLVQQMVASAIAFARKRAPTFVGGSAPAMGARRTELQEGGAMRFLEELGPGMIFDLEPGEELASFSPNIPNTEYFQQVRLILQLIGINLGLPLVALLMDGSETNFSGWRGAMDQARIGFVRNQRWLRSRFLQPVWRWKLRQWISEDPALRSIAERLGRQFYEAKWNAPRWPYIQPLQDAQADDYRVSKRLTSPRRVAAERGADYWEIVQETVEDRAYEFGLAIEASRRLELEYGEFIDPMRFLSPDAPPLLASSRQQSLPQTAEGTI